MIKKSHAVIIAAAVMVVTAVCTLLLSALVLDVRWVRNQSMVLVSGDEAAFLADFSPLKKLVDSVEDKYYYYQSSTTQDTLLQGAMKGAIEALDEPYTQYMLPQEAQDYFEAGEGLYCGIGVSVQLQQPGSGLTVVQVYRDTSAAQAGIQAGDLLVGFAEGTDGEWVDLTQMTLNDAVNLFMGEAGTSLQLEISRQGERQKLTLQRLNIQTDKVDWRVVEDNIGYIDIEGFDGNAIDLFNQAMDELQAEELVALVIDLRDNGGGKLNYVQEITDRVVGAGLLMQSVDRKGNATSYNLTDAQKTDLPMYVLVNGNTASAAEVMAAAVSQVAGGTLVGTKTFGKGVMQEFVAFDDGGYFKYTSQIWKTPNGSQIHGEGLTPDYIVELPEELQAKPYEMTDQTDTQLQKAVSLIRAVQAEQ